MVSHKIYKLSLMRVLWFFTSMLIKCFIDGFTSKTKSQSISYLLNGCEHIYRSTIAGSFKNNSKNKKMYKLENSEDKKTKIE